MHEDVKINVGSKVNDNEADLFRKGKVEYRTLGWSILEREHKIAWAKSDIKLSIGFARRQTEMHEQMHGNHKRT